MATREQVEKALGEVLLLEPKRSLVELNMVRDIEVAEDRVKVALALTPLSDAAKERTQGRVRSAIEKLPGVKEVAIDLVELTPQEFNQFGHVIAVMSGKGGVGKSVVAALLAVTLNRQGYQAGPVVGWDDHANLTFHRFWPHSDSGYHPSHIVGVERMHDIKAGSHPQPVSDSSEYGFPRISLLIEVDIHEIKATAVHDQRPNVRDHLGVPSKMVRIRLVDKEGYHQGSHSPRAQGFCQVQGQSVRVGNML